MLTSQPWSSTLVCRFVADLLEHTIDIAEEAAHQRAIQAFVDELQPWIIPVNDKCQTGTPLFTSMQINETTGEVAVKFTPEGLACFHGWLRRQGIDPMMNTS